MRVKTDDRRRSIMDAAGAVFRKSGFEGTSMSAISAALGGSKGTIYSYFESKEDLFEAVMLDVVEDQVEDFLVTLGNPSGGIRESLLRFGEAYLAWMLSPGVVSVVRSGIEARDSGLGRRLFERGPKRCWQEVAAFLDQAIKADQLERSDPLVAAHHLKGLLQAGLFEPYLFGAPLLITRKAAVTQAVDAFLRAYAPNETSPPLPAPRRRPKASTPAS